MPVFGIFSVLDMVALAVFLGSWGGYEWYAARASRRGGNVTALMVGWRRRWFETAVTRDNRILDIQVLRLLTGNSSFLASTAIFVVGGLAATLAAAEDAVRVLNGFVYFAQTSQDRFGLKIALMILIFTNAFFRLAWSMRLNNNAGVVIGTIPQPSPDHDADVLRLMHSRAGIASELATLAAKHYNGGMHCYYFGLAACAWFIHPLALIAAVVWVVGTLYRREFRSRAHATLSRLDAV